MISNQILQNTIEGLKGITRIDFCVMDTDGKSLASTFSEQENYVEEVISFVESPADSQVVQGYQFFKIFDKIIFVKSFFICYKKILNLEGRNLTYHVNIVTSSIGKKNIL